ncbi:vitamin K epoxide reductase family protein [Sorangium sp. So ce542]|uniref:vitamin K epoxide reductase family protein n=1 Tax=Sorangium sp. So ce542 TaxID=3133316 RepID=UPI003F62832B
MARADALRALPVLSRSPARLRAELQRGRSPDLARRRLIAAVSLAGGASMAVVSLFQMGAIDHLPDPPVSGVDSDKVTSSDLAYTLAFPDAPLALVSFAANLPLAAWGGGGRASDAPGIPIAAAAKAAIDGIVSGWLFVQMPRRERAWCAYCIVAAAANVAVLALSLPEAWRALRRRAR